MTTELPKIPLITYNLKERGRAFTGTARNFNIPALVKAINSPETQERVRLRDMTGFYGHSVRRFFGLNPPESGFVNGKYSEFEPAIVTTSLTASPDGTIQHQTEFLNNESGWKAARMFMNKIGGFSSAIDDAKNVFYGFDYVKDPNFVGNRGFAFDSASGESGVTLDSVVDAIRLEDAEFYEALLSQKDHQIALLSAALDNASTENEHLMSIAVKKGFDQSTVFDSASGVKPTLVSVNAAEELTRNISFFRQQAVLPLPVSGERDNHQADHSYDRLASMVLR